MKKEPSVAWYWSHILQCAKTHSHTHMPNFIVLSSIKALKKSNLTQESSRNVILKWITNFFCDQKDLWLMILFEIKSFFSSFFLPNIVVCKTNKKHTLRMSHPFYKETPDEEVNNCVYSLIYIMFMHVTVVQTW